MPYSQISFLIAGIALSLFSQISHLEAQSNAPDLPPVQEVFSLLYPDGVYDAGCGCVLWPPTQQALTTWANVLALFLEKEEPLAIRLIGDYPFEQKGQRKYFLLTEVVPARTTYNCHACAPVIGGAILAETNRRWSLEIQSQAITQAGAYGASPAFQFLQIGAEHYGVMLDEWGGNQGCLDQRFRLLAPMDGKLAIIARFDGGLQRSGCIVSDADIAAQYSVLPQSGASFFPIMVTKHTLREGRPVQEQIDTYVFSQGIYIETQGMESSAIVTPPSTPMTTPTPFIMETTAPEPAWMLIDTSSAAYTVLMSLPENLPEDELATIKARVTKQTDVQFMAWDEFQASAQNAIAGRIIKNDYPDLDLFTGIIEILTIYPRTPLGVTWNGGVAMTAIDYQYADTMYQTYQANPEDYERTRKKDPKADPVNPQNHFNALIAPKK